MFLDDTVLAVYVSACLDDILALSGQKCAALNSGSASLKNIVFAALQWFSFIMLTTPIHTHHYFKSSSLCCGYAHRFGFNVISRNTEQLPLIELTVIQV